MSNSEINNIIEKCSICILGISDCNYPYLIPMYFKYDSTHDNPFFILESKDTGQKIRYLNNNSKASIFIQYNETDCYKTIFAIGKAYLCEINDQEFSEMLNIKICVKEISGRIYYK